MSVLRADKPRAQVDFATDPVIDAFCPVCIQLGRS